MACDSGVLAQRSWAIGLPRQAPVGAGHAALVLGALKDLLRTLAQLRWAAERTLAQPNRWLRLLGTLRLFQVPPSARDSGVTPSWLGLRFLRPGLPLQGGALGIWL